MNDGQTFTMELYPKVAPVTVENFLKLVDEGFYSGLTFHRVIAGFMAQGGAYDPINQANNPAESIVGEFSSNGYENNLSHQRGVVSMARTMDPNSASSQFFICYDDVSLSLDGEYAAFGYVTEGMETVDSFLSEGTDANDVPNKEVVIKEAKIIE
ncbi:MAG: peptidylprolyl isomerase [Clostridia bacterium]|nr:peptidylprolyl isomerase [Clostridia bacterium]